MSQAEDCGTVDGLDSVLDLCLSRPAAQGFIPDRSSVTDNEMGHPPLEGLLKAPTFNREDDTRKVKRIFDWIGRNVRYDIDAFRRDLTGLATEKETGMTALRQCKATCAGFSDLFCMMCG